MHQSPTRKQSHDQAPDAASGHEIDIETDAGPPRKKAGEDTAPMRRCIATSDSKPQSEMIRFVLSPDKTVTPDIAARLPGRGAWVSASAEFIQSAIDKKAFSRAFKAPVTIPDGLADQTHQLLFRRCLDLLGFAKRSGALILGFDQVREEIRSGDPACIIEAIDGSNDGRKKILALTKAIFGDEESAEQPLIFGCFSASELGMALGRERVIHAVVTNGQTADNWIAEVRRLGGFRPLRPSDWMSLADR